MTLIVQNSRTLLKRSQISGATPTVKTGSTQHTDGTWVDTDIYPGEIYWNMQDRKMYIGWEDISGNTGTDVLVTGAGTGSCITDLFVTNIFGCSPINVWDDTIFNTSNITMAGGQINSFGTTLDLFSDTSIVLNNSGGSTTQTIDIGTALAPSTFIDITNIDSLSNFSKARFSTGSLDIKVDDATTGVVSEIFMEPSVVGINIKTEDASTFSNSINVNNGTFFGVDITSTDLVTSEFSFIDARASGGVRMNHQRAGGSSLVEGNASRTQMVQISGSTTNSVAASNTGISLSSQNGLNSRIIALTPTSISIPTIQQFANDAAAGVGGLVLGDIYETDGTGAAPLNVAGILMRKQ